jgi:LPS export ABC transporter protein LptC
VKRTLAAVAAVLILAACRLDYESVSVDGDNEGIPDMVLTDYRHVIVREGREFIILFAEEGRTFSDEKITELSGVFFRELGEDGEILTEGTADEAVIQLETEDVELLGNIDIRNAAEGVQILSQVLFWDNEANELRGNENETTTLLREDGSQVQGTGFVADAGTKTLQFTGRVRGTWEDEDE